MWRAKSKMTVTVLTFNSFSGLVEMRVELNGKPRYFSGFVKDFNENYKKFKAKYPAFSLAEYRLMRKTLQEYIAEMEEKT